MPAVPQLMVVMPVFNEQASIEKVVRDWFATLTSHSHDFILLAINDGSTDQTASILRSLASELGPHLEIISRPNRGHGQSCIEGYRIALQRNIPYILQIDSDGQSDSRYFSEFWNRRQRFDVIYGKRTRQDGCRRVAASAVLRTLLRILAKTDCIDANVPYRLMNAKACATAIQSIPSSFFLANIALAVCLKRDPAVTHGFIEIGFPPRLGGEAAVPFSKFATKAIELFQQLRKFEKKNTTTSADSTRGS